MIQCPRPLVLLLVLATSLVGAGPAAYGQDAAIFTVSGIPVDATAADAVAARRDALLAGQQEGLARLLRRLVPAAEQGQLPAVASLPIERYVQNFQIANEQLSSTRYLAELTVAFDQGAIRELLQSYSVPFAHVASGPIVVLPFYDDPVAPKLWREDNPWWQAWDETMDRERLLRLVLPLGDLEDMTILPVERVLASDAESVARLAARYNAEQAYLMTARTIPPATPDGPVAVTVEGRQLDSIVPVAPPLTLEGQPGEPLEQVLAAAVRQLQDVLDERWKSEHLLRLDQGGFIQVDVPIQGLADWVAIDRGLAGLEEISQVDVTAFARNRVQAQIHYLGDQFRLEEALARLGLGLSREGDSWLLQPKVASPEPSPPADATSGPTSTES
jgi:hypothetical protein